MYKLLKEGPVTEHSFAYDVLQEQRMKDASNELIEVDLFEVGPTLKGANPLTETLAVKSTNSSTSDSATSVRRTLAVKADSRDEIEEYRRKIDELAGKALRRKSDAELRAQVNQLYDEDVLKEKLEQLKADSIIFEARQRRQEREQRQRAIWRTEARR